MAVKVEQTDRPVVLGGDPVRLNGPPIWPPDDPAVSAVLENLARDGSWGRYHGPHCENLREALTGLFNLPHVQLCCSGTAAVELALRGLGVGPGDEVILAAYDFKANFTNVRRLGAVPVLVDVDEALQMRLLDAAFSQHTACVLVSHLHSSLAPIAEICAAAKSRNVPVIEDVCQAPGAKVDGRFVGCWGDVAAMSFGGSKLLTAGRGGALLTAREDVYQRVRLETERGNDAYPLSEMQAAVLIPQVESLLSRNDRRHWAVQRISGMFRQRNLPLRIAAVTEDMQLAPYKVAFWYDPDRWEGLTREAFCRAVRAEGVALDPGFPALHRIHARRSFRAVGDLPRASAAHESCITLHHPVLIGDEAELEQVADAVQRIAEWVQHHGPQQIESQADER